VKRIIVIGTSGSGKSTLARALAERATLPYFELDAIFHRPNWKELPRDEFIARITEIAQHDAWVVDGNYRQYTSHTLWPRADTIIWLDYRWSLVVSRVVRRTFVRLVRKQVLWNGNRESWRMAFSKQSIVWWAMTMHRVYRAQYRPIFERADETEAVGKTLLRFRTPAQADAWLRTR